MAERLSFWFGLIAWLALLVAAVEILRSSGSVPVLVLTVVALVVLGVSLFLRRSAAGIRPRSRRSEQ